MSLTSTVEQGAVCRVCNKLSSDCLPLFQKPLIAGKVTTLAQVLSYCTGLAILEDEHFLPQHICPACAVNMQISLQFKRRAHRMDRLLKQRQLDLSQAKSNKSVRDALPEAEQSPASGEEVSEEYILVLDKQDRDIELTMEEQSEMSHNRGQPIEDDLDINWDTDPLDEQHRTEEEEEDELAKNWIQMMEDKCQEAEAYEENLFEIVEEPEEQPLVIESDQPKQPKTVVSENQRRKTKNPKLQCQICGKQLSTSSSFKYHMQLHGTDTPYACQICGESFKTRNAHDGHVTLHDPNNPNRCSTCGKVYRQASSLRSHVLSTHSGVKPFECTVCGKRLTQRSGYKKHMLTHTGERPHSCEVCNRSFRYSSNLIAHMRCHSKEKPHKCQVCHKRSFGTNSDLNRHMLVHSSERPFVCDECGKSFKRQVALGQHQQTHKRGRNKGRRGKVVVQEEEEEEAEDHPES